VVSSVPSGIDRLADRSGVKASEPPPGVRGALLVGSMPLADSATVFRFAQQQLGTHLKRIPDGETGPRINWTQWQQDVFAAVPALTSEIFDTGYLKRPKFRLKPGARAGDVRFPPLGYAKAAKASYQAFRSLKDSGAIHPNVRFQVCLPTPIAPTVIFVFPEDQLELEPRYEAAMLTEVHEIVAAIPEIELSIQWDTAIEFAILEGVLPHSLARPEADIVSRLMRLGDHVPERAELGFHLCYGDSGGRHFKEPDDTSKMVSIANRVAAGLTRKLDWLHLPVPKDRFDVPYYRPLEHLRLQPQTELYLGLVHASDGIAGTQQRIASAVKYVSRFGVATECGCGRQKPDVLSALMQVHAMVSRPVSLDS
jgi:hypothetical protein